MILVLGVGALLAVLAVPIVILRTVYRRREAKLREAEEMAQGELAHITRALPPDARVNLQARVGRAENEQYVQKGIGPLRVMLRVAVDLRGLVMPFRLRPRRTVSLAGARETLGLLVDVKVGSAVFDEEWIVEADPNLAKAVLTPEVTARLDALLVALPGLSKLEIEPTGLVVEWRGMTLGTNTFWGLTGLDPKHTTPDPAATLTDATEALLDLGDRIVRHVEDGALSGVGGGAYRRPEPVRVAVPETEKVRVQVDPEVVEVTSHGDTAPRRRAR